MLADILYCPHLTCVGYFRYSRGLYSSSIVQEHVRLMQMQYAAEIVI